MKIFDIIDRFKEINHLIETQRTGKPVEFAEKLGISRSRLFDYLNEMELLGIELEYDKTNRTYTYKNDIKVEVREPIVVTQHKTID